MAKSESNLFTKDKKIFVKPDFLGFDEQKEDRNDINWDVIAEMDVWLESVKLKQVRTNKYLGT